MHLPFRLLVLISLAVAAGPATFASAGTRIDLLDLANAYQRMDHAIVRHALWRDDTAALNRAVDVAAMDFFSGQGAAALRSFDAITHEETRALLLRDEHRLALSLRARVRPVVHIRGAGLVEVRVESLYPVRLAGTARSITLVLENGAGVEAACVPIALADDGADDGEGTWTGTAAFDPAALDAGSYRLLVACANGTAVPIGRWVVVQQPWSAWAASARTRLDAMTAAPIVAADFCRRRIALLDRNDEAGRVARWVLDPVALSAAIDEEIVQLAVGIDPYHAFEGDLWLAFEVDGQTIPCRLYAPPGSAGPRPVVFALHGAGGNEHLFMEAYGAGCIRTLADELGFIVVSPATYPVVVNPAGFGGLFDQVAALQEIDETRVYVLGHSLGAMAATVVAARLPDRVTAACAIGGAARVGPATTPPILLCTGDLDTIFSGARARRLVADLDEDDAEVTLRTFDDWGHVLIVGHVLPECIDWLLARRSVPAAEAAP